MTYTKTVKNELATLPSNHEEMLAEFSAFLNLGAEFHIEDNIKLIDYASVNPTVVKRFLLLSKTLYQAETTLIKKEQQRFTRKPLIILRLSSSIDKIILEHDYFGDRVETAKLITQSDTNKISFLRGAFIVSGSVNDPETAEYHLEIFANSRRDVIFIQSLMNHFNLNARITKRRNGYIVYLKDAESISDFIQLLGAYNSVFRYEDERIKRDFNNSINRLINVELANEKKSLLASESQLEDIELIKSKQYYLEVDVKLLEVMDLREKYPDASFRELTEFFEEEYGSTISRSGLSHRFNRIKKMANKFREEEDI